MKIIFLSILICFEALGLFAQNYAGRDTFACADEGIILGIENPDPEHCYLWEVADGLSESQINEPNPLVTPNETTTYNVTVTDQEFSFKAIDKVTVEVEFGGIRFDPGYLLPNGEDNQSRTKLTLNPTMAPFTWSISENPDGTTCDIDQDGWISKCDIPGIITVRATKTDDTTCIAEEPIEINVGVKDLIVRDIANAGREANDGDTLYMLGNGDIQFEAIPNEGSTFPMGQPEWSGDLTPPGGNQFLWTDDVSEGTYTVTAGEKTVTVIRLSPLATAYSRKFDLTKFRKFTDKFAEYSSFIQSPLCSPIPVGVTLPNELSGSISFERVGKYQHPDWGLKASLSLALPVVSVAGCAPILPCCGFIAAIPGGSVVIFPYVRFSAGVSINVGIAKDPSTANSSGFAGSATFGGALLLAAGVSVDVSSFLVGIAGSAEAFTEFKATMRKNDDALEYQASWGGLQAKFAGQIYIGAPGNPNNWTATIIFPSVNILDGETLPWTEFYDLSDE